jgi:hypothetical protein
MELLTEDFIPCDDMIAIMQRRGLLAGIGTVGLISIAGCSGSGDSDPSSGDNSSDSSGSKESSDNEENTSESGKTDEGTLSSTADRSTKAGTISTADSTSVVVTIQSNNSGRSFQLDDTFSGAIDTASGTIVNDAGGNIVTNVVDSNGSLIIVDDPDPDSQFIVEYTINSVDSETLSEQTGSISITDGSTSDISMGTDTIIVDSTI